MTDHASHVFRSSVTPFPPCIHCGEVSTSRNAEQPCVPRQCSVVGLNVERKREERCCLSMGHSGLCKFVEDAPNDPVDHPKHYTSHPSGVECIAVTEHFNFNRGNAIKYIWRAGDKGNEIEDLKKARWYLDREIARLEGKKP